jgi:flagellar protein FlgJ
MNPGFTKVAVYTDFQGLDKLRLAAREHKAGTLGKVARQFESVFTQMMLKSMRDATPGDGLFDSQQMKFYRGMFDHQLALSLADGRGLGIAAMLTRQLGGAERASAMQRAPAEPQAVQSAADSTTGWSAPGTPADFVRRILPYAKKAARALGVDPKALIAQAALETGWGRSVIARPGGESSLNLFGIKAGDSDAQSVGAQTIEYRDGVAIAEHSRFRVYGSIKSCFDAYVHLLKSRDCYQGAVGRGGDIAGFAAALADGGYATDPAYAAKLDAIANGPTLAAALKKAAAPPIKGDEVR